MSGHKTTLLLLKNLQQKFAPLLLRVVPRGCSVLPKNHLGASTIAARRLRLPLETFSLFIFEDPKTGSLLCLSSPSPQRYERPLDVAGRQAVALCLFVVLAWRVGDFVAARRGCWPGEGRWASLHRAPSGFPFSMFPNRSSLCEICFFLVFGASVFVFWILVCGMLVLFMYLFILFHIDKKIAVK